MTNRGAAELLFALGAAIAIGAFAFTMNRSTTVRAKAQASLINDNEGFYGGEMLAWRNYWKNKAVGTPTCGTDTLLASGKCAPTLKNNVASTVSAAATAYNVSTYQRGEPLNFFRTKAFDSNATVVRRYQAQNFAYALPSGGAYCGSVKFPGDSAENRLCLVSPVATTVDCAVSGGVVVKPTTMPPPIMVSSIDVQSIGAGKIVLLVGAAYATPLQIKLLRFNLDSTFTTDNSFGVAGALTLPIGANDPTDNTKVISDWKGDNSLYVSGARTGSANVHRPVIIKFNASGTAKDATFGNVVFDPPWDLAFHRGNLAAIRPSGGLVLFGRTYNSPGNSFLTFGEFDKTNGAILRQNYLSNTEFGVDRVTEGIFNNAPLFCGTEAPFFLQSDGKVLLGVWANTGSPSTSAVARRNLDFSVDTSFNSSGFYKVVEWTVNFVSVAQAPDGSYYAIYSAWNQIYKFRSNGTLDTSFGTSGVVTVTKHTMSTVRVQSDGKVLVGGQFRNVATDPYRFQIRRYLTNGTLDTTFGTAGIIDIFPAGTQYIGGYFKVLPSDKIIFGGFQTNDSYNTYITTPTNNRLVLGCWDKDGH